MRRSVQVAAPLLATAALTFISGCRKPEMQRCVDEEYLVVDDDLCRANSETRVFNSSRIRPPVYRWYYGGTGTAEPDTKAANGSFEPEQGHDYKVASSPTITRKGFGNTYAPWILGAAGLLLLWRVGE